VTRGGPWRRQRRTHGRLAAIAVRGVNMKAKMTGYNMLAKKSNEVGEVRCPRCGSAGVRVARRGEKGMLVPFFQRNRTCTECEYVFEPPVKTVVSVALVLIGLLISWAALGVALRLAASENASAVDVFWVSAQGIAGAYCVVVGVRFMYLAHRLRHVRE